jgi:hypothetical protein
MVSVSLLQLGHRKELHLPLPTLLCIDHVFS